MSFTGRGSHPGRPLRARKHTMPALAVKAGGIGHRGFAVTGPAPVSYSPVSQAACGTGCRGNIERFPRSNRNADCQRLP